MAEIDNLNWRCFLAFEEELINTQFFVDINEKNYNTFSIRYRSIILQACAEIDAILKKISGKRMDDRVEWREYFSFLKENHENFLEIEINIPVYKIKTNPWSSVTADDPPDFWTANNHIKHQGKFEDATLINCINSLSGLFSLLLAYYVSSHGNAFSENDEIAIPKLFFYPELDAGYLITEQSHRINVPGFSGKGENK